MELTEWHVGEEMRKMEKLREEALKAMTREEFNQGERKTFRAVRDFMKGNKSIAYNRCFKMPWIFYGVYSFEKCVEILINESTVFERKDGKSD